MIYPRYIGSYLGLDIRMVAAAIAAASLTYTFLQPVGGKPSDRLDRRWMIVGFGAPLAVASSLFGYARTPVAILLLMTLFGLLSSLVMPAANALVGSIAPASVENIYSGLYNMMLSPRIMASPVFVGILCDAAGYGYAYISNGVLIAAALALIAAHWRRLVPSSHEGR